MPAVASLPQLVRIPLLARVRMTLTPKGASSGAGDSVKPSAHFARQAAFPRTRPKSTTDGRDLKDVKPLCHGFRMNGILPRVVM